MFGTVTRTSSGKPWRLLVPVAAAALAGALLTIPDQADAAGEPVDLWLTTTTDPGGRDVDKGLEQQEPLEFSADDPGTGQLIDIDESTTYQDFEGGGASFTDTAAWLMRGSGVLDQATLDDTMTKLFDPVDGIGLSFVRNPMGASDLARGNYSYDDTCCDLGDFSLDADTDVLALTGQAQSLNPELRVKGVPWSAPGWMKDNNDMTHRGWLKYEYYQTYADYFVKYIQGYADAGVHVDFVSPQNEPGCCNGSDDTDYPSMNWNANGLLTFTKEFLWPAFRAAGIDTKTLMLDFNWGDYDSLGAEQLADEEFRTDPLLGGIAWHGYDGDPAKQSEVHDRYPDVKAYDTEHSGGTWIDNQQQEDMLNLVDYTRNWGSSWVKWSLAVDQNHGPHNGGCDTCTGLITVHNGDDHGGQVDYTVEYYTMGHLTKFVRPGAVRIASTDGDAVRDVAWKNPDGSKALIAYNNTDSPQQVRIKWNGRFVSYELPARASATFTWTG